MAGEEIFLFSGMALGGVVGFSVLYLSRIITGMMWPIRSPLAIQRGEGFVWDLDERAKYVKRKDGFEFLKLYHKKSNIMPPKYKNVTTTEKGKSVFPLYNTVAGQYLPIKLMSPPSFTVVEDKSAKNWAIMELNRVRATYTEKESTFLKYAPYIMNATFAAMVIFFVIYFGGKMEEVAGSLGGAASALTNAVSKLYPVAPPLVK